MLGVPSHSLYDLEFITRGAIYISLSLNQKGRFFNLGN